MSAKRTLVRVQIEPLGFSLTIERYRSIEHIHVYADYDKGEEGEIWKIRQLKRLHHKSHKVEFEPVVELADGMDEEQAFSKLAEIYEQMIGETEQYCNTLLGKIFSERTE